MAKTPFEDTLCEICGQPHAAWSEQQFAVVWEKFEQLKARMETLKDCMDARNKKQLH